MFVARVYGKVFWNGEKNKKKLVFSSLRTFLWGFLADSCDQINRLPEFLKIRSRRQDKTFHEAFKGEATVCGTIGVVCGFFFFAKIRPVMFIF